MTISYNWLKDYIKCELSAEQLSAALTSIGLEVDSVEKVEEIPGGLKGVVVAHVLTCIEHPDSDHLHITTLDAGDGQPLQVVCGAPNVAAGQKVLLATIGTCLGEDFKIKKSKIRGVESNGMICAEDELGIGTSHDGIMVLDPDAVPGTPAAKYLGLKEDYIIEIGLTANRVDAASHIGVARDLYAYLKYNGVECSLDIPSVEAYSESGEGEAAGIEVLATDDAPRYSGITIRGVKVGPSPDWLVKKLAALGHRSINNIVDITNFVLLETGQPLHAFDLGKVEGGKIIVRRAEAGEPFTTLDGIQRKLYDTDLVIADASRPMCLAGVFGGLDSGVTESTVDVFLESAYFNPVTIRKTSRLHTIKTDASFRYERGADPLINEYAAKRAALLILELAGGTISGTMQKVYSKDITRKQISLDFDRIERFVGKKIGHDTIRTILSELGYEFVSENGTEVVVAAPSYMIDVYRECDVVEEILRIYGYDNIEIPTAVKVSMNGTPAERPDHESVRRMIADFLSANGFVETMNNSLTKGSWYEGLKTFPAEKCVKILNPLSSDLNVMRQSLIPGGLEVIERNVNHQKTFLRTYEFGSVYSIAEGADINDHASYSESSCFTLMITGTSDKSWNVTAEKSNFFALKGYVELLLRRIGADIYSLGCEAAPEDVFAEGVTYTLPGSREPLMTLGTVHPTLCRKAGVKQPVYAAEISFPVLYKLARRAKIKYSELPRFPEVRRDLALLLDEGVSYSALRSTAFKAGKKVVKSVGLFDVYRGDKIASGKKQYALSFVLQDPDRTLTDTDVEKTMERILAALTKEHSASLR